MAWSSLFERRVYLRFSDTEVVARSLRTGREYRDSPLVALVNVNGQRTVCAVGEGARTAEAEMRARGDGSPVAIVNPFAHERLVIADVEVAEALVRYALGVINGRYLLRPSLVVHPTRFASELTDAERYLLQAMAAHIGASHCAVHEGPALTDAEVRAYSLTAIRL